MAIEVISEIKQKNNQSFALLDSNNVRGGLHYADNYTDILNTNPDTLHEGTLVYVKNDQNHWYQYVNGSWVIFQLTLSQNASGFFTVPNLSYLDQDAYKIPGMVLAVESNSTVYIYNGAKWREFGYNGSIPIYTKQQIDSIGDRLPLEYIAVADESDLNSDTNSKTINLSKTGNLVDILFSSIRALQSEVTKLRNSFKYGIDTYNGTESLQGDIVGEKDDSQEPLWALDKSDFGEVKQYISYDENHGLIPADNVNYKDSQQNYLIISNTATFNSLASLLKNTDSKEIIYLTINKKNIIVHLSNGVHKLNIDFSNLIQTTADIYNIQIILSRQKTAGTTLYGHNYIWINITNNYNDTIVSGYYSNNTLYRNRVDSDYGYSLSSIDFTNLNLYDLEIYTKNEQYNQEITPTAPSRSEDKYRAAYIKQRVFETKEQFNQFLKYVPDRTFAWIKDSHTLYFICDGKKYKINGTQSSTSGGDNTDDSTMTIYELLVNLKDSGIITLDNLQKKDDGSATYDNIRLNDIAAVQFINEGTKEKITFKVNSEGQLVGTSDKQPAKSALQILTDNKYYSDQNGFTIDFSLNSDNYTTLRGFIPNYIFKYQDSSDAKLQSDRLKIGAFYAPLSTDRVFGCSHAFVELENTAQTAFNLDGYILHYAGPIIGINSAGNVIQTQATYHIALKGTIPAGGTYLIRGKQYADYNLPQTYIKVDSYDMEWYVNEYGESWFDNGKQCNVTFDAVKGYTYAINQLIDFTNYQDQSIVYGFALTYREPNLKYSDTLIKPAQDDAKNIQLRPFVVDCLNLYTASKTDHYMWNNNMNIKGKQTVTPTAKSNTIYKNTFELDPAKQAFQSFSSSDSSRLRHQTDTDYMYLNLDKQFIQFPHSKEVYDVTKFTPKASKQHKNVCTDKTQLDLNKPNMPICAFGINIYTTRCFNWLSAGKYDEYLFIRKKGDTKWNKFESYTKKTYNYPVYTNGITYQSGTIVSYNDCLLQSNSDFTASTNVPDTEHWINYVETVEQSTTYPRRVEFSTKLNNVAYSRITNTLPASNILYTSHKCIVDIVDKSVTEPTEYEWCCGRANYDGTPQNNHVSDILTFTLYPETYKPKIYQVTDQQGFHWIEYQVWAAAAIKVNERINKDQQNANIIPIVIDTGDMTQNGTRINEWLDYYNAALPLANHLEQMYVVGNNDLGNTDPTSLGTGDDSGKSNPYFYNLCYCYQIPDSEYTSVFTGTDGITRFIPSLYYFDTTDYRYIMVNSEITYVTDEDTYFTPKDGSNRTIDLYTGYPITGGDFSAKYINTPIKGEHYIYEILYQWTNTDKKVIAVCHEMPFTVVTNDNLAATTLWADRSVNAKNGNLIGSHMNKPYSNSTELVTVRSKGLYWFSRLLEFRHIHYCIGGHKHTYACSWPVRENYYYKDNISDTTWKHSLTDGPMTMNATLENDLVNFILFNNEPVSQSSDITIGNGDQTKYINLTKQPLIKKELVDQYIENNTNYGTDSSNVYKSYTPDTYANANYVVYLMCQATGFKLKSNKELPGIYQKFSAIIPKTKTGEKPANEQQSPMYVVIDCTTSTPTFELIKLWNINNGKTKYSDISKAKFNFTQQDYSTNPIEEYYLKTDSYPRGTWTNEESQLNLNL